MSPSRTLVTSFSLILLLALAETSVADRLRIFAPDLPSSSEPGGVGRDAEIVKQVLKTCGHDAEFVIQPFGRHIITYRQSSEGDAVMTVPLAAELPGASTAAYIWYQNGAVYDADRISEISGLPDLWGLDVVTFKDGIRLLDLGEFESKFGSLVEIANQRIHSHLLFLGRVDVILADGLIVAEINRRVRKSESLMGAVTKEHRFRFAPIFTPAPYKMVFREPALAKSFDECFDMAYANGTIYEINQKYIGSFQNELGYRYLGF